MSEPNERGRERNGYKEGKKTERKTREKGGDVGKASFSGQKRSVSNGLSGGRTSLKKAKATRFRNPKREERL